MEDTISSNLKSRPIFAAAALAIIVCFAAFVMLSAVPGKASQTAVSEEASLSVPSSASAAGPGATVPESRINMKGRFYYDPSGFTIAGPRGLMYDLSSPVMKISGGRTFEFVVSNGKDSYIFGPESSISSEETGSAYIFTRQENVSGLGIVQEVSVDAASGASKMTHTVSNGIGKDIESPVYYYVFGMGRGEKAAVDGCLCGYGIECVCRNDTVMEGTVKFSDGYSFNYNDLLASGFSLTDTIFEEENLRLGFSDGRALRHGESAVLDPIFIPAAETNVTGTSVTPLTDGIFAVAWLEGQMTDLGEKEGYVVLNYLNGTQIGNRVMFDPHLRVAGYSAAIETCSFNSTDFVIAYFDHYNSRIYSTIIHYNGTGIYNISTPVWHGDSYWTYGVGVDCLNSTHYVTAWQEGSPYNNTRYDIYDYTGAEVVSDTVVDATTGYVTGGNFVGVAALNSTYFAITYVDGQDVDNAAVEYVIYRFPNNLTASGNLDTSAYGDGVAGEAAALNSTYWAACWHNSYSSVQCAVYDHAGNVVTPAFYADYYSWYHLPVEMTAINDHEFAVAYYDSWASGTYFSVHDIHGNLITPPVTLAGGGSWPSAAYDSPTEIASYKASSGIGICDDNVITVAGNWYLYVGGSLNNTWWDVRYKTGTIWNGVCQQACNANTWYNTTWAYRKKITINSSKVDAQLNNFPVLINTTDASLASYAQEDGRDILFTDCSGTVKFPHEIEHFNGTTGRLVAWVGVSNISADVDTDIYMYFSNSTQVANQSNATGVWDEGYAAVHHFEEVPNASTTAIVDSTRTPPNYKLNFSQSGMNASNRVEGKIGYSIFFDGKDDDIYTISSSYYETFLETYEFWIKDDESHNESGGSAAEIFWHIGSGDGFRLWPDAADNIMLYYENGPATLTTNSTPLDGNWHQVVITYDNRSYELYGHIKIYVDGQLAAFDDNVEQDLTSAGSFRFGGVPAGEFKGYIDEFRYSNYTERTEAYIKANYYTQSDPSSFAAMGTLESQTGGPFITIVSPGNTTYYSRTLTSMLFNVTATDVQGVSSCRYSLDGTANITMGNTTATSFNATNSSMTYGQHSVMFHCNDTQANWSNANVSFTLANVSPPTVGFVYPTLGNASTTYNRNVDVNVTITEAADLTAVIYNWNGTNYTVYDGSLVLLMNFDNRTSIGENSTNAVDASLYGNNGTVRGSAAWQASGKYGGAYKFNGSEGAGTGNITVPDDPTLDGMAQITVSAWIKLHSRKDWSRIVAKDVWNAAPAVDDSYILVLDAADEKAYMRIYTSSSTNPYTGYSTSIVPLEQWTFITGTYNGTRLTIYVDGVAENYTDATAGAINQSTVPLIIGNDGDGIQAINATIDEVRIYNRSLSAAEISQLYFTNLYKYNNSEWVLFVNQSKDPDNPLDYGNYTYQVVAADWRGDINDYVTRAVTVDANYSLSITDPTASMQRRLYGGNLTNATLLFLNNGTANITSGVTINSLFIGSTNVTITAANFTWVPAAGWRINYTAPSLANGYYDLFINATYDGFTKQQTQTRAVYYGATSTSISVVSPTNTTYYETTSVTFNVTAADIDGVSSCRYSLDGTANITMGNTTATSFNATNSTMTYGQHNATFHCNDTGGSWGSANVSFTLSYYTLSVTDPTTSVPRRLLGGNATNATFQFLLNGVTNITTGVAIDSLYVGSTRVTIAPSCAGTLNCSVYSSQATCQNCSSCLWQGGGATSSALRTATATWGTSAASACASEGTNTQCASNCAGEGERITEAYVNATAVNASAAIAVTCEYYSPTATNDTVCVYYRNSSAASWQKKTCGWSTGSAGTTRNWTATSFTVDSVNGTHEVRCQISSPEGEYTGYHWSITGSGNRDPGSITTNGTYYWVTDTIDGLVYMYHMSGAYTGVSFDVSGQETQPDGITQNGTFFWINGMAGTRAVYKYWMNGTYTGSSFSVTSSGAN